MNFIQKAYCRVFQTAFHLAKPFLPYRDPVSLNSLEDIPPLLKKLGIPSVLLVTDRQLRGRGITAPLERLLEGAGIHCAVYDGNQTNPTVHDVERTKALYLEHKCQGLIAFGGGCPMDCAKAAGALIARPGKTVGQLKGILRVRRKLPTLIAIPTTAGTGSETTLAAVITDSTTHHKFTINDFSLIPHYAVLDPTVTYTLPSQVTATTGMDALTHAVEAYIGRSTTAKTRAQALEAVKLIFGNLEKAYACGTDAAARANMLRAAYLAGAAFSVSYVGYVHAVAHTLGGQYNIPHGLANAVLLPVVLEAYGEAAHKKLHDLAIAAGVSTTADTHAQGAAKLIAAIRGMNSRMGIPGTLPGIRREDVPRMAHHAHREANPLYPVPVLMDAGQLAQFYDRIMEKGR